MLENKQNDNVATPKSEVVGTPKFDIANKYYDSLGTLTHYYINTTPTKLFLSDLGKKGVIIEVNQPVDLLEFVKEDEINHDRGLKVLINNGSLRRLTVEEYGQKNARYQKIADETQKIRDADYKRTQEQLTDPDAALKAMKTKAASNVHTETNVSFATQSAVEKYRLYKQSLKDPNMPAGAVGWGPNSFIAWLENQKLNEVEVEYITQMAFGDKEIMEKIHELYPR